MGAKNITCCSIPCNLCGSRSVKTLSIKDRDGKPLRTVICRHCGLIWNDPRPDEPEIRSFYAKSYRREYKGAARPRKKHIYRDARQAMRRYRFFRDQVFPGARVLDIGSGSGVFVYCLRRLGLDARGVEPDESYAEYARETLGVSVETGFAADVREEEFFDVVTLNHVLEHMTDPRAELERIGKMLKPGGVLVVGVPNAEDGRQDSGNRYHRGHLYTFNPATLEALGEKAGFSAQKREIAPFDGDISVVFRKAPGGLEKPVRLPGNYERITSLLDRLTNFRHYTRPAPYLKFLANNLAALRERLFIRRYRNDTDIIAVVMAAEQSDP